MPHGETTKIIEIISKYKEMLSRIFGCQMDWGMENIKRYTPLLFKLMT
jgi:hypothetical protein